MNPARSWKSWNDDLAGALCFGLSGGCAVRGRFFVYSRARGKRDKSDDDKNWNHYFFHVLMSC